MACHIGAKCAGSGCSDNGGGKSSSKLCPKIDPKTFGIKKVAVIGSGNWGSTLGKIVAANAQRSPYFQDKVRMWVFEEVLPDGRKLTEVINTEHENVKYLSGIRLPPNLVAVPDVVETAKEADYILFVVPHQFLRGICDRLKGNIKSGALGISAIKGFDVKPDGTVQLISELIASLLGIEVAVIMGANLARPIAMEEFSETTIGFHSDKQAHVLKQLFQTEYFRVETVRDASTVEICGALKNIVALGAGFCDGLSLSDNTKAAVIRNGLIEMVKFANEFYPGGEVRTFFESCGVADLITTCYGGRNRQVAAAVAKTGKSFEQLEAELLGGQRLQGPATAEEVHHLLKSKGVEHKFPLFVAVYRVYKGELQPKDVIECLKSTDGSL